MARNTEEMVCGFTDRLALRIRWWEVGPCVHAPVVMLQSPATIRIATHAFFGMSRRPPIVVYVRLYVIG